MLEFYEFNTFNIIIVLVCTFIIYNILLNFLDEKKDKKTKFSLEYLIISIIIAFSISLLISYIRSNNDEKILTDNFWDPIKDTSPNNV